MRYASRIDEASTPPPRPPGQALSILRAVAALAGFLLAQVVAYGVLYQAGQDPDVTGTLSTSSALQLGAVQLAGILAGMVVVTALLPSWKAAALPGLRAAGGWRPLAPAGLVIIGPTIGAAAVSSDPIVHEAVSMPLVGMFGLLALLIAINEELWFRGIMMHALGGSHRPRFAVWASAILFGLPHIGATAATWLNASAVMLAVGVPFAVVRLRSGSLIAPIGWHAAIDLWAFVHTASVTPTGTPTVAEGAASLVLPLVLAVTYIRWLRRAGAV